MRTVKGYKLFKMRKDGSIGPLFINKQQRLEVGVWYDAEDHPTAGYQHRPGWHAALEPIAPHLSEKGRVWAEIRMARTRRFNRPQSQGGTWVLADRIKVVRVFKDGLPSELASSKLTSLISRFNPRTVTLGINADGALCASWPTVGPNRHRHPIRSMPDFEELVAALPKTTCVLASSSLDFPSQYTKDPAVLSLCHRLRS